MEEYNVTFVHPTTGATLTAQIDPDLTADEVIEALAAELFIEAPNEYCEYLLVVAGGMIVKGSQSLFSAGVRDGDTIQVTRTYVDG